MTNRDVLLVTGGSRGIGAATVARAVQRGSAVAFCWAGDAAAAREVAEATGAFAWQADVADREAVRAMFDAVEARLGPVTRLVNNAGIAGPIGPFAELGVRELQRVFEVNVYGTMHCAQEAVQRWSASGTRGVMVNVSSTAATLGSAGEYVHYAASKAAVDTFTLGLARELAGHGIRVNAVAPGTTQTDIHARAGDAGRPARVAPRIPMQRVAEAGEIADAILWLLSDEASYVTGSVLRVGGGL